MIKKKYSELSEREQEIVKYIQIKNIVDIVDIENMSDYEYVKLLIYITLLTNEKSSFVDCENTEYSIINGELITKKLETKEKIDISNIIKPEYVFSRVEYQKKVIVEKCCGFVTDSTEYINDKTYYEYSEDSYERKNWRDIEYKWKNYIKELNY